MEKEGMGGPRSQGKLLQVAPEMRLHASRALCVRGVPMDDELVIHGPFNAFAGIDCSLSMGCGFS